MEKKKRKVLLIEDSLGSIRIISDMLKLSGHNEFELYNSVKLASGFDKLRSLPIDIILINLELPDSHGLETLTILKKTFPEIPVIVLSNLLSAELAIKVAEKGAQDLLVIGHFDDNLLIRSIIYSIERKKGEKKLEETSRLLDTIFNNTNSLLVYMDTNFNVIKINKAFQAANGREFSYYTGKNYFDFVPFENVKDKFEEAVATGEPCSYYSRPFYNPLFPERGVNYWDWTLTPLKDERDKVYALLLTITNVTEHAVWEKKLQEEKDKAQKYFDIAGVILLVLDTDGNIVQINNRGCNILGYSEKEAIGLNWFDNFIPSDIKVNLKEKFLEFVSGSKEGLAKFENKIVTKDGSIRTVDWENIILTDSTGKINGTLSSGVDITEQKKLETASKENKDLMNAIVESAMDAIISVDEDQRIICYNKAAESVFGYCTAEMTGKDIGILLPVEYRGKHKEHIRNFGNENTSIKKMVSRNMLKGLKSDGQLFDVEVSISQVSVQGKKVYTAIVRELNQIPSSPKREAITEVKG